MKKDTISTGAFWIGAFGAFASLRRINKYVRPVNHNPIVDLAILGVELAISAVVGGGCSVAADTVVSRYEKWKEEKKKEKEEEEDDFEDEFSEGEPVDPEDPEDGIHFTVINTETNENADDKESDNFILGWDLSNEGSSDTNKKGSEADGDV